VNWDDGTNLIDNPSYRGLGWTHLRRMATTFLMGHYIPLTWLTFGFDYVLWGMNPVGYHLTSLLLHVANAVLSYFIAGRHPSAARDPSKGKAGVWLGAAVAASVFAIPPLRVESVAWATERRDVLSGLFYLMATLLYLRAAHSAAGVSLFGRAAYWASV